MKKKDVVIIGAGIAGMEAASSLNRLGYEVLLVEEKEVVGGHLLKWEKLFPTMRLGGDVLNFLKENINGKIEIKVNCKVVGYEKKERNFILKLSDNSEVITQAIIVTTGYSTFDATKKEEYGYGIYANVITSEDLEEYLRNEKSLEDKIHKIPERIVFAHCVGSRDEKVGNIYCSKVCCVTAVKQSIEIKEKYPNCEVFCFYMDLRMYDLRFEELYKEAQEKHNVHFIRGRLSEVSESSDTTLLIKAEDTLLSRPLKMKVDLLVLMVGFVPSKGTIEMGKMFGLNFNRYGFLKSADEHLMTNISNVEGIFLAGTVTAPRTITNTISDARAAALNAAAYVNKLKNEK